LPAKPPSRLESALSIAEALKTENFNALIHAEDFKPPLVKYVAADNPNVEIEFLSALTGSETERDGRSKFTEEVQSGITSQRLRYLDLLLTNPWHVNASDVPELEMTASTAAIRLPNPSAYIMQKVLISRGQNRKQHAIDKDRYYIYEISVVFRDHLDALAVEASGLRPVEPRWYERFRRNIDVDFGSAQSAGVASACRVHREAHGATLNPEVVFRSVDRLIERLPR
jgi:hypothetical protein